MSSCGPYGEVSPAIRLTPGLEPVIMDRMRRCYAPWSVIRYADPQYHREGDTADRVDCENVLLATQASLAAILHVDRGGVSG